ncbi:phytanoyl-CoA dioxygenase family protein [Subtercola boreus]|uniref:Phytanoyl-CoA dioxygenase n=1 Tax=Subtercola boreus TaxID=120213 RepID=A0A3E0W6J8_9MICO|nr:phytanoyl-CoA dioxygenase family protein [Subtercola boreus]RFA18144.1 phytanoyl-CoA dioxygenase [Subtercola boreus]RFA18526.1 phytanoyl-CoA dioxygenase [Subtercola boreus]RFA25054.1 phytanoyl-CoA dioxygenase [Subtercola boreus]
MTIQSPVNTIVAPVPLPVPAGVDDEIAAAVTALYTDGVTAKKGAFSTAWADELREDIEVALAEAHSRPNGAVGRGPKRYYVEMHPEQMRGWLELVDHPWVRSVCEATLGPDYRIIELGFDVPGPGAKNQPWHRDFPMPDVTRETGRLTSLAFNATAVDTDEDMGPFEIAQSTQFDLPTGFEHEMFPSKDSYGRYEGLAVRKYPKRGDLSARSALTIHRGTENHSEKSRPVLVLGVDAPGAGNAEHHDMAVTRGFYDSLPQRVRDHLACPVVDVLVPITQKHSIEGLMMGEA